MPPLTLRHAVPQHSPERGVHLAQIMQRRQQYQSVTQRRRKPEWRNQPLCHCRHVQHMIDSRMLYAASDDGAFSWPSYHEMFKANHLDLLPDHTLTDIPQVIDGLTARSPEFSRRSRVFRPERCRRSRKRPELGGSNRKPTSSWPGGPVFQRVGQTCPAAFVQFGSGSR